MTKLRLNTITCYLTLITVILTATPANSADTRLKCSGHLLKISSMEPIKKLSGKIDITFFDNNAYLEITIPQIPYITMQESKFDNTSFSFVDEIQGATGLLDRLDGSFTIAIGLPPQYSADMSCELANKKF